MNIITNFNAFEVAYLQVVQNGPVHVWYFGSDAERCLELQGRFADQFSMDEITALMNEAADSIADDLINMDSMVLASKANRDAWDASLISDLSPYVGDLQLNISRFLLLRRYVQSYANNLFIVDDDDFGCALSETAKVNNVDVNWFGKDKKSPGFLRFLKARLSAFRTFFRQERIISKLREKRSAPWDELKKCDVILLDWAEPHTFQEDEATKSFRNLRSIPQILRDTGLKVGFIANPISWTFPYQQIAENVVAAHDPVVLIDECRSNFSIFKGAWQTWRLRKTFKGPLNVGGCDVFPLFNLASLLDMVEPQASLAFTFQDVGRVLASHGVSPKTIMLPYENQGWERVLKSGIRKHLPTTRCVSYQFVPISKRLIGFYPSQREILDGKISDELICVGHEYMDWFSEKGFPKKRLSVGGSLQFASFAGKKRIIQDTEKKIKIRTVLCSTSVKHSESLDLVLKTIGAAKKAGGMSVIVNFHPVVPDESKQNIEKIVRQKIGNEGISIEFSNEKITHLLSRVDAVTYNSSGSSFDAMLMDIKVIYVSVDGSPSYNRIPDGLGDFVINQDALADIFSNAQQSVPSKISEGRIDNCIGMVKTDVFVDSVNDTNEVRK